MRGFWPAFLFAGSVAGCGDEIVTRTEGGGVGGRVVGRVIGPDGPVVTPVTLPLHRAWLLQRTTDYDRNRSRRGQPFRAGHPRRLRARGHPSAYSSNPDPVSDRLYWRHDGLTSESGQADTLRVVRDATLDSINVTLGGLEANSTWRQNW
ncbi:MAG: hypothetical protein U0527_06320 [Candidatus Eisenbacteria bacterium]